MMQTLQQLLPIFVFFGIGVLLRQLSLAEKDHGVFLLRVVFNVCLPLLVLSIVPTTALSIGKGILPLANIAVCLACMLVTLLAIKILKVERNPAGTMLVNTMMVNSLFMLPFILLIYGEAGFVDAILFNSGDAILMGSYVYIMACKYRGKDHESLVWLKNIYRSPLLWALVVSIALSVLGVSLSSTAENIIDPLAQLTSPLIMIAMGIIVSFKVAFSKLASISIFIRMLMGFLFGISITAYLGLEGSTFMVVSLCAAAPIGVNAMTYLSAAKLDAEDSESAISISTLLGLIYMPLIIIFFGSAYA